MELRTIQIRRTVMVSADEQMCDQKCPKWRPAYCVEFSSWVTWALNKRPYRHPECILAEKDFKATETIIETHLGYEEIKQRLKHLLAEMEKGKDT